MELVIKYQKKLYRVDGFRVPQRNLNIEVKAVIFSIQVVIIFPRLQKRKIMKLGYRIPGLVVCPYTVSYTHLTLPTKLEV